MGQLLIFVGAYIVGGLVGFLATVSRLPLLAIRVALLLSAGWVLALFGWQGGGYAIGVFAGVTLAGLMVAASNREATYAAHETAVAAEEPPAPSTPSATVSNAALLQE